MKIFPNERAYENAHVFLWLLKDTSWSYSWSTLGMCMILPTLLVQLHITWKSRKDTHEIFHNLAVICWILANATWMTGEFFYGDGLRPVARLWFALGIALMLFYYSVHFRKQWGVSAI